jgi:hypothetical protein
MRSTIDERHDMVTGPGTRDELAATLRTDAIVLLKHAKLHTRRNGLVIVFADPLIVGPAHGCTVQ